MFKTIIIINGAGGSGKDTLISAVSEKYKIMNESAIDPVKVAACNLGWTGGKEKTDRKFLSDLKQLSIAYNNFPTKYLLQKVDCFLKSDSSILFVHIREAQEIKKFKEATGAVTLLIRRSSTITSFGNVSDDNVENYQYDYVFNNEFSIEKSGMMFIELIEKICYQQDPLAQDDISNK